MRVAVTGRTATKGDVGCRWRAHFLIEGRALCSLKRSQKVAGWTWGADSVLIQLSFFRFGRVDFI